MNGSKIEELQEVNEMIDSTCQEIQEKEAELKQAYTPAGVVAAFLAISIVMVTRNPNWFFGSVLLLSSCLTGFMGYTIHQKQFVLRVIKASLHDIQGVKRRAVES